MGAAVCLMFAVATAAQVTAAQATAPEVTAAQVAAPEVTVTTLQGAKHAGSLSGLTGETATVQTKEKSVKLPVMELMSVGFPKATAPKASPAAAILVTLTDGTRIRCTQCTTTTRNAKLDTQLFGKLTVSLSYVAHIRFAPPSATLDAKWVELCERKIRKDFLVIPKPPALSHLDGVVGRITSEKVQFTLGSNTVPVDRSRVFGVIYLRTDDAQPRAKAVCQADMAGGDVLQLASIEWDDGKFVGRLRGGSKVEIPTANLKTLDFSLGKVKYLSAMEPRDVKFTTFYDDPLETLLFHYRKDRALLHGHQLQLDKKKYARGLWIHSRTVLKYRLGKDYRRFRAVMGIDDNAGGVGDVHVVISGDGKTLHESDVRTGDKPVELDIDVKDVRELEILVDYGRDRQSTSDHLVLAEARIIK